jgi:hypothetical protein
MNDQKLSDAPRPFCPVHHWRMAYDAGSSKVPSSHRCVFGKCTIRFTSAQGYFEAGKTSGEKSFLSRIESIAGQHDRDHHLCIVGYAKESLGGQTEEWRTWKCSAEGCDFSTRQRLSSIEPAVHLQPQHRSTAKQYAYADR